MINRNFCDPRFYIDKENNKVYFTDETSYHFYTNMCEEEILKYNDKVQNLIVFINENNPEIIRLLQPYEYYKKQYTPEQVDEHIHNYLSQYADFICNKDKTIRHIYAAYQHRSEKYDFYLGNLVKDVEYYVNQNEQFQEFKDKAKEFGYSVRIGSTIDCEPNIYKPSSANEKVIVYLTKNSPLRTVKDLYEKFKNKMKR